MASNELEVLNINQCQQVHVRVGSILAAPRLNHLFAVSMEYPLSDSKWHTTRSISHVLELPEIFLEFSLTKLHQPPPVLDT